MARFVQPVPSPGDPYPGDRVLSDVLSRLLGPERHDRARPWLAALGAEVAATLRDAHTQAEAHPPVLHRYDAWGARVDRLDTPPGWQAQRAAAARHGVVALPYLPEHRDTFGAGARVVQHALLHLYGPESATFSCPVAMSDGAAALLHRPEIDPAVRDAWLPRLLSTDPDTAITSGQWMTESQGGSDVSRSDTTARRDPAGTWRLTGEKWFCSAADAPMAVALARPEHAGPGSRVLAPFLVARYAGTEHGIPAGTRVPDLLRGAPAAGLRVHRLKDKLGTRALPTAEIGLSDVAGHPLGDPAEPGLHRMMTLVVITRLHNCAAAAAGMRRGLEQARAYAATRRVAGGLLRDNPLHRATLADLAVAARAAYLLAAHAFALLGRVEVDADPAAEAELRLVAPLAKLLTGRLAVASASEYVESFGGPGYVEDTGVPRLLRDAQVLPIWEGTTNVLSLDVARAVGRREGTAEVLARLRAAAADAGAPVAGLLRGVAEHLHAQAGEPLKAPAAARDLALRLATGLAGALLVEQAAFAGREDWQVAAALWSTGRLGHADTAEIAERHYEIL